MPPMTKSKFFWTLVFGALIGGSLSSWLAPKAIAWYFDPPAGFGVSCKQPIEWALQKLQIAQLAGTGIGALCGVIFYFVFKSRPTREEIV